MPPVEFGVANVVVVAAEVPGDPAAAQFDGQHLIVDPWDRKSRGFPRRDPSVTKPGEKAMT